MGATTINIAARDLQNRFWTILTTSALAAALAPATALGATTINIAATRNLQTDVGYNDTRDAMKLTAAGVVLTPGGAATLLGLDIDNQTGAQLNVDTANITLGSVMSTTAGANRLAVDIADARILTLDGAIRAAGGGADPTLVTDNYTALGDITINDATGQLVINSKANAAITLNGNIIVGGNDEGLLDVNTAGATTTLKGNVGATGVLIKKVALGASSRTVFEGDVYATDVELANDAMSKVTFGTAGADSIVQTGANGVKIAQGNLIAAGNVTFKNKLDLTVDTSLFTANDGQTVTVEGNLDGHAASKTNIGSAAAGTAKLVIDSTGADRVIKGFVDGSATTDDTGTLEFNGANKVTANVEIGDTKRLAHIKTGAGLATFSNVALAKKLTIGTGGVSAANNLTIGSDGATTATGKLTFTELGKTLSVAGNYAATGVAEIHLDKAGAGVLKYIAAHAVAGNSVVDAAFTTNTDNAGTLTFAAANAANKITIKKDIGATDKQWKFVNLNGADTIPEVVLDGKKVYASDSVDVSAIVGANKLTFQGAAEIVGGKLKATNNNAIIQLAGDKSAAKVPMVLAANNKFASFNVLDGAKGAKLTIGVDDTNKSLVLTALDFQNAANDTSGLEINLAGLTAGQEYALSLGAANMKTDASIGGIKFINNPNATADQINVTVTDNVGASKTKNLALFDATGSRVKLTGAFALHSKDFKASEVQLESDTKLGIYNTTTTGQVGKIVLNRAADGNASVILADSKLKVGTEVHFGAVSHEDTILSLGKSVSLTGKVTSAQVGSKGILEIGAGGAQTVKLTATGTKDNTIKSIDFKGAAAEVSTLTLDGAAAYADNLNIGGTGTLNFTGHLKGSVTKTAAGTLVLKGGSIEKSVGAAAAAMTNLIVDTASTIVVGSDDAAVSAFHTTAINFKKLDGGIEIHANANGTVGTRTIGTVKTETKHVGRLVFNADHTTNGNIGEAALPINSVTVKGDKVFTVINNNAVHANNVMPGTKDQNTLTFAGASVATETAFGSKAAPFKVVNVTAGVVNLLDVYSSTTLDLTGAASALTARHVSATGATGITGNVGSIINVKDTGSITGKFAGNVATLGSATLNGDITGTLNTKAGAAGKVVTLKMDTVTGAANLGASTTKLAKSVTFTNGVTATAANLDFGKYQAKVGAGKAFTIAGNATLTVSGTTTPIITPTLTVGKADVVSIKIGDLAATDFAIATNAAGNAPAGIAALTGANFKFVGNEFFKETATFNKTTGKVSAAREIDVTKVATSEQLAVEHSKDFMTQLVASLPQISSSDKLNEWGGEYLKLSVADKNTIVDQVSDNTQYAGKSNHVALDMSRGVLDARGNEVAGFASTPQGIAAGDAADKFGLWAKGTFGTVTQNLRKGEAGYKSSSYGAFVGVDTMLNDKASVGLMVGYANDRMKLKDSKAGGKTKANSWMFGAYGTYDLPQNFFVQGNAAVAQTAVKTQERRLAQTATGKYDVIGYTAEVRGGYKLRFDNSLITPTAGLRFNYLGDTSYTETGAALNNKKVAGKATTGIDAVAGVALSTALDVDGLLLNPEVHMNVDYALANQAGKVDYNLDGSNVKFKHKGAKPAKFGYNFGASVMTQADNVEYGVGYDARIADKYIGHQGSVKVKVSF